VGEAHTIVRVSSDVPMSPPVMKVKLFASGPGADKKRFSGLKSCGWAPQPARKKYTVSGSSVSIRTQWMYRVKSFVSYLKWVPVVLNR
jgi:hypothetical protein